MTRPTSRDRNAEVDFRGWKRSNATRASATDPDARLYRKSAGTGAMLCFMGLTLMENRSGLIVQADLNRADGYAERRAAVDMTHRHSPGSTRPLTLGADKDYDSADFVVELRHPHVARKPRHSISARTSPEAPQGGRGALRLGQDRRRHGADNARCVERVRARSRSPWRTPTWPGCLACWPCDRRNTANLHP